MTFAKVKVAMPGTPGALNLPTLVSLSFLSGAMLGQKGP